MKEVITMNDYLVQTKFAASNLIDLISSEENTLKVFESSFTSLKAHHKFLYDDFIRKDFDPDDHFNEHQMMYAFAKQAKFHQEHIEPTQIKINELIFSMSAKEESIKTLSGALLQIAKQGISVIHGNLDNCIDGRIIKNEPIKNIIWQGRNQSLHYEEGTFRPPIVRCFGNLGIELKAENLAKEIIDILDWNTYENYEKDLISLFS